MSMSDTLDRWLIIETFESKQFHPIKIHRNKFLEHDVHNLKENDLKLLSNHFDFGTLAVPALNCPWKSSRASRAGKRRTIVVTRLAGNKLGDCKFAETTRAADITASTRALVDLFLASFSICLISQPRLPPSERVAAPAAARVKCHVHTVALSRPQ